MNRRDLLKLFGVGASIVPVIGGEAIHQAEARLIEIPKVEPIHCPLTPAVTMPPPLPGFSDLGAAHLAALRASERSAPYMFRHAMVRVQQSPRPGQYICSTDTGDYLFNLEDLKDGIDVTYCYFLRATPFGLSPLCVKKLAPAEP